MAQGTACHDSLRGVDRLLSPCPPVPLGLYRAPYRAARRIFGSLRTRGGCTAAEEPDVPPFGPRVGGGEEARCWEAVEAVQPPVERPSGRLNGASERERTTNMEAPEREAQESNGPHTSATAGDGNGRSHGAKP